MIWLWIAGTQGMWWIYIGVLVISLLFHVSPMIKKYAMRQCHGIPISMCWWKWGKNYVERNDGSVSWWNRLYRREKTFIIIIKNLNEFTINLPKTIIKCLGKTKVTGKKKAIPSPTNRLQPSWTAAPLCPPTIVLWIG